MYDTPETRRQKAEAEKKAQEKNLQARESTNPSLAEKEAQARLYLGKTFWYLPNPAAQYRLRFYEKIPPSSHSLDPKFVFTPLTATSFVVTGVEMPPPTIYRLGEDQYLLKIEFPDGKVGYVNAVGCCGIAENLYPGERSEFREYVMTEPPEELFAKERAAAESKAREEQIAKELRDREAREHAEKERIRQRAELELEEAKTKLEEAKTKAELRQEQARRKAEAARPPTPAEKTKMTARANGMDFWQLCAELGRVLRNPNTTPKGAHWEGAVIGAARVSAADHGNIRARKLRIGMDECSVVAVLGKPDGLNRTNNAHGRSDQLVYRAKGMYVYTENGVVRSWQE